MTIREDNTVVFLAKHDWRFMAQIAAVAVTIALLIVAYFVWNLVVGLIIVLPLAVVLVITLLQLWRTDYTLEESMVTARCGLQTIRVSYGDIECVELTKASSVNGYIPFALSRDAIYIIYGDDGGKRYRLEVSPADKLRFSDELARRMIMRIQGDE